LQVYDFSNVFSWHVYCDATIAKPQVKEKTPVNSLHFRSDGEPADDAGKRAARVGDGARKDWRAASRAELIAHVLARYHARHREQLPELLRLARRVEQVHGSRADCPSGLAEHLAGMQQELESHMMKEEQVLFPILARGLRADGPVTVMRFEHEQHGQALARIEALTDGISAPAGACNTWRALYARLIEFRDDLVEHIELENEFLFLNAATETSHA
jgi:regulator of cell morphogenesis and NO signaling